MRHRENYKKWDSLCVNLTIAGSVVPLFYLFYLFYFILFILFYLFLLFLLLSDHVHVRESHLFAAI